MKNAASYLRNQIAMALIIIFSSLQWGCIEELEPREPRSTQPAKRPSVTSPEPGTRKPNPNHLPNRIPTERRLEE